MKLLFAGMIGMFLLALGLVLFFLAYQRRIIQQQKEHQRKETDYQQKLIRANLLSQEKERNRIGKDLHDEVGAMLTTSKLYFRYLDKEVEADKFVVLKQKALQLLDETMASVRRVSHDLRPAVLERLGLVEAIANIADQLNETEEIKVYFKNQGKNSMDKEYELNWFRIVQELVNNTLKHAEATEISIELISDQDSLNLVYQDNGIGLETEDESNQGLGMQNIESRLQLMNGSLKYCEKEGSGICLKMITETGADLRFTKTSDDI